MPRCVVVLALALQVCLLVGCNGGGTRSVLAQSSYSDASLSGTYAISFNSTGGSDLLAPDGSSPSYGAVGTLQFNGTGNVSGGTITAHYGTSTCVVSLTGTYSIQSTGLGTITVTPVVTSGGCSVSASWRADLAVAQQGVSFNFASNTGTAGSAAKQ
jgi:hypothetical protein